MFGHHHCIKQGPNVCLLFICPASFEWFARIGFHYLAFLHNQINYFQALVKFLLVWPASQHGLCHPKDIPSPHAHWFIIDQKCANTGNNIKSFFPSTLIIFSDECLNNALFQFKNFSVSGLFGLLNDWLGQDPPFTHIFYLKLIGSDHNWW